MEDLRGKYCTNGCKWKAGSEPGELSWAFEGLDYGCLNVGAYGSVEAVD
jgi:hypothetical protein